MTKAVLAMLSKTEIIIKFSKVNEYGSKQHSEHAVNINILNNKNRQLQPARCQLFYVSILHTRPI